MSTMPGQNTKGSRCPLCGQPISDKEQLLHEAAEQWILELIQKKHPEWVQEDGLCPKCLEYFRQLGSQAP